MKKQVISMTIAGLILSNSFSYAAEVDVSKIDPANLKLIEELVRQSGDQQLAQNIADTKVLISNVSNLITSIEEFKNDKKKTKEDKIVSLLRNGMAFIGVALQGAHAKQNGILSDSGKLVATALIGVINSALLRYETNKKLTLSDVKDIINENQSSLSAVGADNLTAEQHELLKQAYHDISTINQAISTDVETNVAAIQDMQMTAGLAAVVGLASHFGGAKFLPARLKEIAQQRAQTLVQGLTKTKNVSQNTLGVDSFATLGTLVYEGFFGENAESKVDIVIDNLIKARLNLETEYIKQKQGIKK